MSSPDRPRREPIPDRSIELTDPRAMRAYAHPVRLALIGLLRTEGPLTATQAAARLGESSGTCSFHLRQLAKYGFCEEAGGGQGREKPWRATARSTNWSTNIEDPELADAQRHLDSVVVQHYIARVSRWLADRHEDSPAWRRAAGFGDQLVPLTAPELEQLRHDIDALLEPYRARTIGDEEPPEDARRVALIHFDFPEPEGR
jgi:predicted ArsR family transcriptional regulator